jgi:hypothetical protein
VTQRRHRRNAEFPCENQFARESFCDKQPHELRRQTALRADPATPIRWLPTPHSPPSAPPKECAAIPSSRSVGQVPARWVKTCWKKRPSGARYDRMHASRSPPVHHVLARVDRDDAVERATGGGHGHVVRQ